MNHEATEARSCSRQAASRWWMLLVADLAICGFLGSHHSIGSDPILFAAGHLWLLVSLYPLIHWFPFEHHAGAVLLGIALIARLLFLPMAPSDDVHRYVWEGRVLNAGFDPYVLTPDSPELVTLRDTTWEGVNHKDMTAIYPPGALLLFRALAAVHPSVAAFKFTFGTIDLLSVALLLALLRAHQRRPAWALLYILNPIVLCSYAGEGHLDSLLILCLLVTLLMHAKGHLHAMFVALALAIHAKYVAVLILPFLITRRSLRAVWILPVAGLLPLAPFWPATGLLTSLTQFSSDMHYNGSIHALLGVSLDNFPLASRLCVLLLIGCVGIARLITPRPLEGAALVLSALLLLSPNVHFWYLSWVIPLLCFYPYPAMLLFCATLVFSFRTLGHQFTTNVWQEFPTMMLCEYLPVYAVLVWSLLRLRVPRPLADANPPPPVRSVSVIAPVLNEAAHLDAFLAPLQSARPHEIILADGGSTDDTVDRAHAANVQILDTPPGRGRQIAAGIRAATGDVIFVAHADMQIDADVLNCIVDALNHSGRIGGCVGCRFEGNHPFLALIAFLNAGRARWAGISFGDQGQFVRRDILETDLGGFPDQPLMEDVELSLRLKALERPLYLGGGITVSPRRWHRSHMLPNALLIIRLVASYSWKRWRLGTAPNVDAYYRSYYGHAPRGANDEIPKHEGMSKSEF